MNDAEYKWKGELVGISAFKSTIEPFSQRMALKTEKSQPNERPTICVFELIKLAWLFCVPAMVPRD